MRYFSGRNTVNSFFFTLRLLIHLDDFYFTYLKQLTDKSVVKTH